MSGFDYFVVFAEMRTGSNFLEANINMFDGLHCMGEAFNPHFIGYPDQADIFGVTRAQRDEDPSGLIKAVRDAEGLCGFRYFNDHDPRVLDNILSDPKCAKIILTRNPVDSFVSWKIAAATGQWKLTNVNHAKSEQITFDPAEFEAHVEALQAFQVTLLKGLQTTGQTGFYVAYEDLHDIDVMNGLARYLGCDARIKSLNKKLKKQNPAPMSSKVANFDDMTDALARMDRFNLTWTPNFEPRRGPMIPTYVAAAESPLLYMPLRSGPTQAIKRWMAQLDGQPLQTNFGQSSLREWRKENEGHRSFTVLRHPVAWAHTAFCKHIVATGPTSYPEIRASLRKVHRLVLPEDQKDPTYDRDAHHAAFLAFLQFLKANLSAQTAIRVDNAWASQTSLLQGISEFGVPDMILREDNLRFHLATLAGQIGKTKMPDIAAKTDPLQNKLEAIYDAQIESAARQAYSRDYIGFGFGDWQP